MSVVLFTIYNNLGKYLAATSWGGGTFIHTHTTIVTCALLGCCIVQYQNDPVDLKAFMQYAFDPHDKLDEIAIVFAYNYYALINEGEARLRDVAPLYTDTSVSSVLHAQFAMLIPLCCSPYLWGTFAAEYNTPAPLLACQRCSYK